MNKNFAQRFRKIINDLKRRPEDAAKDLGLSIYEVEKILEGKTSLNIDIIDKATKVWPVNHSDFFSIEDDTSDDFKIFKKSHSDATAREMLRDGKPYYLYKDTVMSKISPFRPEWIEELVTVEDSDPYNNMVKFNNGHFLHQFTYFIGPVNFYYVENGEKKITEMNTGDSMYISPYIPHSFTTRKNKDGINGLILALTYTDKIDNQVLNELQAIGNNLSKKFKLNLDEKNKIKSIEENINYYLNICSIEKLHFENQIKFKINEAINEFLSGSTSKLSKIATELDVNLRDILLPLDYEKVKIQFYNKSTNWYLPNEKNKKLKLKKLTDVKQLPSSKSLELTVLSEEHCDYIFSIPCHQYMYNVGETTCNIKIGKKVVVFENGDSIYLKPNVEHSFGKKSKILILRIGGKISGDNLFQLSMLDRSNYERLLNDNMPWFN